MQTILFWRRLLECRLDDRRDALTRLRYDGREESNT